MPKRPTPLMMLGFAVGWVVNPKGKEEAVRRWESSEVVVRHRDGRLWVRVTMAKVPHFPSFSFSGERDQDFFMLATPIPLDCAIVELPAWAFLKPLCD